jgi:hypothetical protein
MLTVVGVNSNGNERNPESVGVPPVREASAIGKKNKKCSGKINPKRKSGRKAAAAEKAADGRCAAGFSGCSRRQASTQQSTGFVGLQQIFRCSDDRQTHNGFRVSGLQFKFFGCSRRQANKQQGFGFSAEFRIWQQIYFRSSEGSDGDLDTLDADKW